MTNSHYNKTTLDNGLTIVTEQMPWVRSVTVGIWVKTGSIYETDAQAGISHILEHMVFKGTSQRTGFEIVQAIEGVGGHINAFTSRELTCYYAQILDDHVDLALDILCSLVADPLLTKEDLEKEKLVVTEEIRHYEDTPHELIFDYFSKTMYGNHPLARPIMGSVDSVNAITQKQLADYRKARYTTDQIIVAATGNLDHDKLVKELSSRLTVETSNGDAKVDEIVAPAPAQDLIYRAVQGAHICRGVPGVSYASKRKMPILVLSNLLGGGMSSRLFQRIREKEALAYNIYSFMDTLRESGVFGVYVGTDPEKVNKVLSELEDEYSSILDDGLTEDEISRVKEQFKGNLMLGLEGTASRMFRLAKLEIYLKKFLTLDEVIAMINAVTVEDVAQLANAFLDNKRQYTAIILPKEEKV